MPKDYLKNTVIFFFFKYSSIIEKNFIFMMYIGESYIIIMKKIQKYWMTKIAYTFILEITSNKCKSPVHYSSADIMTNIVHNVGVFTSITR